MDIGGAVNTTSDIYLYTGKIVVGIVVIAFIAFIIISNIVINKKYKK